MENTIAQLTQALVTSTTLNTVAILALCIMGFMVVCSMIRGRQLAERLNMLCEFMAYMEDHKDRLPRDVFHRYDMCHKKSVQLMIEQGVLKRPEEIDK